MLLLWFNLHAASLLFHTNSEVVILHSLYWRPNRFRKNGLLTLPSFFSFPKLRTISWTTAAPLWGSMPPNTQESRWPPRMTYLSRKHHCKITFHSRSRTEQTANDSIASKHKALRTQDSNIPKDLHKYITILNVMYEENIHAISKCKYFNEL